MQLQDVQHLPLTSPLTSNQGPFQIRQSFTSTSSNLIFESIAPDEQWIEYRNTYSNQSVVTMEKEATSIDTGEEDCEMLEEISRESGGLWALDGLNHAGTRVLVNCITKTV
eukprot:g44100.t1